MVCIQNHDQIGNRARGERLSKLVDFEALKLAAGATALAPFVPLLFMGEEYGETAPFQYFTSHGDAELIEAVRKGRQEEFSAFAWEGEIPDPQAEETFSGSKLHHEIKDQEPHRTLRALYRELLSIRRESALAGAGKLEILENGSAITMLAGEDGAKSLAVILEFGKGAHTFDVRFPGGTWTLRLDSADPKWRGPGISAPAKIEASLSSEERQSSKIKLAAQSFAVFERLNPISE